MTEALSPLALENLATYTATLHVRTGEGWTLLPEVVAILDAWQGKEVIVKVTGFMDPKFNQRYPEDEAQCTVLSPCDPPFPRLWIASGDLQNIRPYEGDAGAVEDRHFEALIAMRGRR